MDMGMDWPKFIWCFVGLVLIFALIIVRIHRRHVAYVIYDNFHQHEGRSELQLLLDRLGLREEYELAKKRRIKQRNKEWAKMKVAELRYKKLGGTIRE